MYMSESINKSADQAILNHLEQIDQPVQVVIQKAGNWTSHFARSRLDDLDSQGLCLALFTIYSALKSSALDSQPQCSIEITERLLEKLLDGWDSPGDSLRSQFESGGFITPLMAAAALVYESPTAKLYRERCQRAWLEIEKSGTLLAHPALLWMGRHLVSA